MNLEQFLDHYGVEYTIQGNRVVTNERRIRLENKGITELPNDIGRLVCIVLDLSGNKITHLPDSIFMVKCELLWLSWNQITEIPDTIGEFVGVWLYLSNNSITKLPDSIKKTKVNELNLSENQLGYEPNNPIGYDSRYRRLKDNEITDEYICCDKKLMWYKSKEKLDNYTIYKGYHDNYVVQDGEYLSRGDSIQECVNDIIYRKTDRDIFKYQKLDQDKKLPLWEIALMYRTITGCCSASTQEFLEINKLPDYLSINDVKKSMDGRNTNKCFLRLLSKENK